MHTFRLPLGYKGPDGPIHREVELLPLTGKEEELLARFGGNNHTGPLNLVLERCLKRLGAFSPVHRSIIDALSEQDRLYLLWQLQQNTFGDRVQGTVSCTGPGCGKPVDIDFSIQELTRGIFTGAGAEEFDAKPELEVHCPECNAIFPFLFDLPGFFLNRLRAGLGLLYHEVHILAYHYHWSENEILALPREKRKMYLQLLASEIQRVTDDEAALASPTPTASGPRTHRPGGIEQLEKLYRYMPNNIQPLPQEMEDLPPRSFNEGPGQDEFVETTQPVGLVGPVRLVQSVQSFEPAAAARLQEKLPFEIAENESTFLPAPGDIETVKDEVAVVGIRLPGCVVREHRGLPQPPKNINPGDPGVQPMGLAIGEGVPIQRLETLQSLQALTPFSPLKKVEVGNGEEKQPGQRSRAVPPVREEAVTAVTPVYSATASPIASAFWERMFMGRFHLKFLR